MAKSKPTVAASPNNSTNVVSIIQKLARHFQQNVWPEDIKDYKDYVVYTSKYDKNGKEIPEWQTNGTIPISRMHNDVMFSSVYDNVLQSRVSWRTKEDHVKADTVRNFVEWGMSRGQSRKELIESAKEAIICWEGYNFMGFKNVTERIKYKDKDGKPQVKEITEQYPFLEYVSTFDVMFDPTVTNFYKSKYVIRRRIEHIDEIKARYSTFIKDFAIAEGKAKDGSPIFSRDYNRIKFALINNEAGAETMSTTAQTGNSQTPGEDISLDFLTPSVKNQLTINYEGGFYEVIEYWEKRKFILLLNGVEVYSGPNPFPVQTVPVVQMLSNKIPGAPISISNSQAIRHVTRVIDSLMNLTVDNIKLSVCPLFEMAAGTDIDLGGKEYLEYDPFKIYKTTTPGSIKKIDLGTGDFSGVNLTQFFIQIAEMISGTSGYAIGYQNKVERSATWVSALTTASKTRLNEFMDSMNLALSTISEFWIQCGIAILPGEISIKIDDPDGEVKFQDITIEDIIGKFDFEFDAKALKTATRELQRAQAMKLLELAAQVAINPVTGEAYVNVPELFKIVVDSFEFDGRKVVLSTEESQKMKSDAAVTGAKFELKTQKKVARVQERYGNKAGGTNPNGWRPGGAPAVETDTGDDFGNVPGATPPAENADPRNAPIPTTENTPTEQWDILSEVMQ
jgi:hypothetical protein